MEVNESILVQSQLIRDGTSPPVYVIYFSLTLLWLQSLLWIKVFMRHDVKVQLTFYIISYFLLSVVITCCTAECNKRGPQRTSSADRQQSNLEATVDMNVYENSPHAWHSQTAECRDDQRYKGNLDFNKDVSIFPAC